MNSTRRTARFFSVDSGNAPPPTKKRVEDIMPIYTGLEREELEAELEVESLITTICDTSSIAEFKLNLTGFNLYIKRNLVKENVLKLAPNPPLRISTLAPVSNGSASSTSLTISKSKPSSDGIQKIPDIATDEGLVILQSPKVGYFRR